jgi:hypothetical protein
MAAILPSLPLFPKPPGTKMPDTLLNNFFKFLIFKFSESILIRLTFRLLDIPP